MLFHNGSNYDYHFIIKQLVEKFEKHYTYFEENTEQYITFTVPLEKEVTKIDKNGEKITKNIFYMLQIIDCARFMAILLSIFINSLSEGNHRVKCKYGQDDKRYETCRIKYKYCNCYLEYANFKDDLIERKCLFCNKNC